MTTLRVQDVAYRRNVAQPVDTLDRAAGELDRVALETLSLLARWADDGGRS